MENEKEFWYRYKDVRYAPPLDEWGYSVGEGRLSVELETYLVVKHTPKGVQLVRCFEMLPISIHSPTRFVLLESRKRFACPTKEEALESFIARKEKQISIYNSKLKRAKESLEIGKYKLEKLRNERT